MSLLNSMDSVSYTQLDARPAIPGVHGGAGHDQIPHTGQAAEGLPGAPQLLPQAGNLRHSPGHQQGFGIVLIAQTVAHTAAEGNDVLQRRRQLHAHDVAAGDVYKRQA